MRRLLFLLAAMAAMPAVAQPAKPSFDCAKASTEIEKTICKTPDLAKLDRALASAYSALLGKLDGAAKDHLQKDQLRWITNRNRGCVSGELEMVDCLKQRYEGRLGRLAVLGKGAYPFISEQAVVKSGKVKATRYVIDASYPQFDGTSADFAAVNRQFLEDVKTGATDAVPEPNVQPDLDQTWSFDQSFNLHRPVEDVVCVEVSGYAFTGGAHGFGGTYGSLVDLKTGRILVAADVFVAGNDWRRSLRDLVIADLKKQFEDHPGFDDALEPKNIDKLLEDRGHFVWQADKLELVFNAYEVGPYAAGPYYVDLPYARIKTLLRADGPLGSLR